MKSNLAGLYIQIEAKKRRIEIINGGNPPKNGRSRRCGAGAPGNLSRKRPTMRCNPTVNQRKARLAVRDRSDHESPAALRETSPNQSRLRGELYERQQNQRACSRPQKRDG